MKIESYTWTIDGKKIGNYIIGRSNKRSMSNKQDVTLENIPIFDIYIKRDLVGRIACINHEEAMDKFLKIEPYKGLRSNI